VVGTAGCLADRARPSPVEEEVTTRLSVQLLGPRSGMAIMSGDSVHVSVHARDLDGFGLSGLGFVARRFSPGLPTIDSAAVHFTSRSESTHVFSFAMPDLPTNTQVDIYGIAFGGGLHRLSTPSYVLAVRCAFSICR
jgi:hypothetical protein